VRALSLGLVAVLAATRGPVLVCTLLYQELTHKIMIEKTLFAGAVLAIGLVGVANGIRGSVREDLGPGVTFDLGVGTTLTVFGVLVTLLEAGTDWRLSVILLPFFLVGMGFLRQHYVLVEESNRRRRDLSNSLHIAVPSGAGMFGGVLSVEPLLALFLFSGLWTSSVGALFLMRRGIQWIRGERVYIRDVVAALVMVSMLSIPTMLLFAALASFPP